MRICLDCIPCFIRQALDSARAVTEDEQIHEQVLREVLRLASDLDMRQSPPAIGQQIHRVIRALVGNDDPYQKQKQYFNNMALQLCQVLKERLAHADDPFEDAVRLAIAGNIIDLAVKTSLAESDRARVIDESLTAELDGQQVAEFKQAVNQAEHILNLTDNAGEIVFDRLLIERLPVARVTVGVRGKPVINDAALEDAEFVGLTDFVEVIDNGSDAPGTILETCSQSFRSRFEAADLIIAKGQGNYETLSDVNQNIFFFLKAKCPLIAEDLGCDVGEMVLRKNNKWTLYTEPGRVVK